VLNLPLLPRKASPANVLPYLCAFLCLSPLIVFEQQWNQLYWFHDDWELLNDWTLSGSAWIWQPFAENFSPVFKSLWVAAVTLGHGSYAAMIRLLWLTHLAILSIFIFILRKAEFPAASICFAVITVGLAWSNIETLGWATQWNSLLATLFLMIGWAALSDWSHKRAAIAVVASVLSALCFSRGMLSGPVLAAFAFLSRSKQSEPRTRYAYAAILILTSLLLLSQYRHLTTGHANFQNLDTGKLSAMILWGIKYETLNPLYHLISVSHRALDLRAVILYGALKASIMAAALFLATRMQRQALWTLLVIEFGTAGLLSVGRYHTGDIGVVSFRYQYILLLVFGPFLAVLLHRAVPSLKAFVLLSVIWAALLGYPWKRHIARWSESRGVQVRQALASAADNDKFGLPSITAGRARELIREYNLH
jgi:hypothetical protein